ncbi:hypothetical protein Tco_1340886 [Tanacetum coccineum]
MSVTVPPIPPPLGISSGNTGNNNPNRVDTMPTNDAPNTIPITNDEEPVSSEDEGTTRIRAFMAITEDKPFVGKADARSGQ